MGLIEEIYWSYPELEALSAQIQARGGSPWEDPYALGKLRAEIAEFWDIADEDADESLTEIADIIWYLAKLPAIQRKEMLSQAEAAIEAAGLTPKQAVACCLAKYRYRAGRERGKSEEHREKERMLCVQSVKGN